MFGLVRQPVRAALLATTALFVIAACGGSTSSGNGSTSFKGEKKFGLSIALTGQSAIYGDPIQKGMKLALSDLDAKGGVNGYKISPDVLDDGTDVTKAVNNTKQLILQDNVVAVEGAVTSGQCQAASPVARQNKVLYLAATCNSYQLTTEPDLLNPYYVSIVPNTYMEGIAAGELAAKLGTKRIFIVSPKYLFGISETNAFVAALKKYAPDAQIINSASTWYVPFPTNPRWDSTINQIQSLKPDLVYSNIFAGDQVNFVTQALQVDPNFFKTYPMTTLSSVSDLDALKSNYPLGMHLYMRAPFFALSNTKMNAFVTEYKNTYNGEYPSDWAVLAYDDVNMWASAANAAGSFDSDAVLKKIQGHSFSSLRGYNYTIRSIDNQANVGETIGTTASSGGKYEFPVLSGVTQLNGSDTIIPTNLVNELKAGQCEATAGVATTTDFTHCPSWK